MAKKRKKRRSFVPESEAKNAVKKSFKEFNWHLAGRLLLSFVIIFGLYQMVLKIGEIYNSTAVCDIVVIVYILATTVLASAFIILNRGLSNDIPTKEQLRDDWTDNQKEDFIEKLKTSKQKAKKLLIVLIPLIFTLLFDMMYLLFFVK